MANSTEDSSGDLLKRHLARALEDARHSLSNPVTVISGNAQLLQEMARMMDLGDEFVEPLEDIDEAVQELETLIDEVYTAARLLEGPPDLSSAREEGSAGDEKS